MDVFTIEDGHVRLATGARVHSSQIFTQIDRIDAQIQHLMIEREYWQSALIAVCPTLHEQAVYGQALNLQT